jgi:hypothetical protein
VSPWTCWRLRRLEAPTSRPGSPSTPTSDHAVRPLHLGIGLEIASTSESVRALEASAQREKAPTPALAGRQAVARLRARCCSPVSAVACRPDRYVRIAAHASTVRV